jgi:RNA-directed DNA polymerase
MFNLGGLDDLARALGISLPSLHEVLDDFDTNPASLVKELTLWPADQTKKPRDVISIRKRWRHVQDRIYRKLLLPWFEPLKCCHGGVRKRSPATNARMHVHNRFALVADISNFFPSVSCDRVNKLFLRKACSYEVASALTRLCTYDYHLALGLITSPVIANEILRPVDEAIEAFCKPRRLVYSRFIDDITISGRYSLRERKIGEVIESILSRHHFRLASKKTAYGRLDVVPVAERAGDDWRQLAITGVRLKGNHLDPSRKFIDELDRIIADHLALSKNESFTGPLYMQSEIFGKVYYACSLNPGRRRSMLGRLKEIDWWKVMANAADQELIRFGKRLRPRGEPRPGCSEELPLIEGAKYVREYWAQHDYDPSETPFDVDTESTRTGNLQAN